MKKSLSTQLIFLLLVSSSCYSTYPLKTADIKAGQRVIITTYDDKQQEMVAMTIKEDSLYGSHANVFNQQSRRFETGSKSIAIPITRIKSAESKEYSHTKTFLLTVSIIALAGYIIVSTVTLDIDPFPYKK